MITRKCPRCEQRTTARECCGIHLDAPFRMTPQRIQALRRHAHGRKGLDDATYRLHLSAVGAASTTTLTREQYHALLVRLNGLPDRQRPQGRAAAC